MMEHLQRAYGVKHTPAKGIRPYRRHSADCPYASHGTACLKCKCPLWVYGVLNGKEVRRSLKTRNLEQAWKKVDALENGTSPSKNLSATATIDVWIAQLDRRKPETAKKYRRVAGYLKAFCQARGISTLQGTQVTDIDAYVISRKVKGTERPVSSLTIIKELEIIKQIFGWAIERGWAKVNPVKPSHFPAETPLKEVVPYTFDEKILMLAACERFGNEAYERLRAKAQMLLMRYYGLRISDVALFRRDAIEGNFVRIRASKNGADLLLPLYEDLRQALECLPVPEGCSASPYYFWTGTSDLLSVKKGIWRTLRSVFLLSGVKNAHPHRFRHTLATEILIAGGSIQDVAEILGDSELVVRKHYKRWCQAYQARITRVFASVHDAPMADHLTSTP